MDYNKYYEDNIEAAKVYFSRNIQTRDPKETALYYARCFGHGLNGADEKTAHDIITGSYSTMYVKNTLGSVTGVVLSAKEWYDAIRSRITTIEA